MNEEIPLVEGHKKIEKGQEESDKFIKINEILSYGIDEKDGLIHIHVVPEDNIGNILVKFKEGLRELALIVKNNEQIKIITGTSWIIAKHPRIVERFGFTLDGEIGDEMKAKHFADEKREIHGSHISREDFLEKYYKE